MEIKEREMKAFRHQQLEKSLWTGSLSGDNYHFIPPLGTNFLDLHTDHHGILNYHSYPRETVFRRLGTLWSL